MEKITIEKKKKSIKKEDRRATLQAAILLLIFGIVLIATGIKIMDAPILATIEIMCGTLALVGASRGFNEFSRISKKRR